MQYRIGVIHATQVSMTPIQVAFAQEWPEVELVNILDDALSVDRAASQRLDARLSARIEALANYANSIESDAILYACSAFGAAIEAAASKLTVPVLKPNEAMFEAAAERGERVAMLYTFAPAKDGMEEEFNEYTAGKGLSSTVSSIFVPEAIERLRAGDAQGHDELVADQASRLEGFDVIMLAHFSTARAKPVVEKSTEIPVLSSPQAAVKKLQILLGK